MQDAFKTELLKLASKSPELREAIARSIGSGSGGYYIPTGDITQYELSKTLALAVDIAQETKVADIADMLKDLRETLSSKEKSGEALKERERTLRDLDIIALATQILILWTQRNRTRGE